jgi:hypothetical protein
MTTAPSGPYVTLLAGPYGSSAGIPLPDGSIAYNHW